TSHLVYTVMACRPPRRPRFPYPTLFRSLINSIVGITRRFGGSVALAGLDITALRPDQRARAGIGWVPQERNTFRSLTVEENMTRSEEHTSELQSRENLVCRLLLEKSKRT